MHLTGHTRIHFVIGDPIAQVRAPALFNGLFARHGVDAVLVPVQVRAADLEAFVRSSLAAPNVGGLWVTIPHKTAVHALLDHCDALGRAAGAVNAVRRRADGSLDGALFDGTGFVKALGGHGIAAAGRRVLLAGCGGAGTAIAVSLAASGARQLALFDAIAGRAADLARRLAPAFAGAVTVQHSSDPAGFDLVVNATPLGLDAADPMPFDVRRIEPHAAVVDILMTARPTPLLEACAARGIAAHSGHAMLEQQIPEYLSFFGFDSLARQVRDGGAGAATPRSTALLPASRSDSAGRAPAPIPATTTPSETP